MRIHQDTINEIQSRLQIEEVIGDYVSLKKKGKDLWGLCPFHHEKTPSFSVVPRLGFYKCFGCDAKGDTISFLMQHHNISYVEALHLLAEKYQIPIEQSRDSTVPTFQKKNETLLYDLLTTTQDYYIDQLIQPSNKHVYNYLKQRGLTDSLIKKFHLGYSPNQWQGLYTYATTKGYDLDLLKMAGLVIEKENKIYDRFRKRIMFPIHNLAGIVIGFGARRLDNSQETSKYINSPETPVYKKSQVLYGLYQAKQAIKEKNSVYLVEGYTDVLALHREGISNVVASSGTSLTPSQIQLLSRFTQNIILLFDSDIAGSEASIRSINLLLAQGLDVKVVSLPMGEDPDSYAKKEGKTAFLAYLQRQAQDFIAFKAKSLCEKNIANDLQTKQEVIQSIVETLSIIPGLIKRALYTQLCSKLLDLPQSTLELAIHRFKEQNQVYFYKKNSTPNTTTIPSSPRERTVLYILLHYSMHPFDQNKTCGAYLMEELNESLFTTPSYKMLFEKFQKQWQQNQNFTGKVLIEHQSQEEIKKLAIEVMSNAYNFGEKEHENLAPWCFKSLQYLKLHQIQQLLSNKRNALDLATTQEEVDRLLVEHQALKKTKKQIAKNLSMVLGL